MTDPSSRRNFLRGRFSARKGPQRPPWALAEAAFLVACTRCGDCLRACPTRIVIGRDAGYPTIDFGAGECTFCGDCTRACTTGALHQGAGQPPWMIVASVDDRCLAHRHVECRICGDLCEARAIRFSPQLGGPAQPQVDSTACTGCGACVAPCPAHALKVA